MEFIGPAQQSFQSFLDLTFFSLNNYWPNWNNLLNPISYILPPTFHFFNPDKSDEDIWQVKNEKDKKSLDGKLPHSLHRKVKDRKSDAAEFQVFQALWSLAQDKVNAPYLAVRGLNFDKIQIHLQQIFPHAQENIRQKFGSMMREFDFVLIGPKIGIIVIEVKSSSFTQSRDFAKNHRFLPDHITDAVKQLNSFDPDFFSVCSSIKYSQKIHIRKILFTPNLEKDRFDTWFSLLDSSAKDHVQKKLADITHWFKEDLSNSGLDHVKCPLRTVFRQLIESKGFEIRPELFTLFGALIAGLGSALVLGKQFGLVTERLSTSAAVLSDAAAMDCQKFQAKVKKKNQNLILEVMKNANSVTPCSNKPVMLTSEQQRALNGPNRQFIIGPAGSGKTMVLQTKALEMLADGKSIAMVTTGNYHYAYKTIFEFHYFKNFTFFHGLLSVSCFGSLIRSAAKYSDLITTSENLYQTLDTISELTDSTLDEWMADFDAIFIDEAADKVNVRPYSGIWNMHDLLVCFFLLVRANTHNPSKLVWVASDPNLWSHHALAFSKTLNQILQGVQAEYFSTIIFQDSESAFHITNPTLSTKLVMLTSEQQKALNGPNRQLIIGPPGTGKTIVLQAKALEMLASGKSIAVVTKLNYRPHYQRVFESHGFKNFRFFTGDHSVFGLLGSVLSYRDKFADLITTSENLHQTFDALTLDRTFDLLTLTHFTADDPKSEMDKWLAEFDGIFVDDAVDSVRSNMQDLLACFLLMICVKIHHPSKIVWIASDPNPLTTLKAFNYPKTLNQILKGEQGDYFSTTIFQRVMRSSESVFHITYPWEVMRRMTVKPVLGHKIHGFSESVCLRKFPKGKMDVMLWKYTKRALDKFLAEGFSYSEIAIITGYEDRWLQGHFMNECEISNIPTNKRLFPLDPDKLSIEMWDKVSSLEWPVVIFVSVILPPGFRPDQVDPDYKRYRACSRATMKIFEIIGYCHAPDYYATVDVLTDNRGQYTVLRTERSLKNLQLMNMSESTKELSVHTRYNTNDVNESKVKTYWKQTRRRCYTVYDIDLTKIPVVDLIKIHIDGPVTRPCFDG